MHPPWFSYVLKNLTYVYFRKKSFYLNQIFAKKHKNISLVIAAIVILKYVCNSFGSQLMQSLVSLL